jgi:hypothetical protein
VADALACGAADCGRPHLEDAAPAPRELRALDLMAKDYDSLLRLMLDALPTVAPRWADRAEADLGMALLEPTPATSSATCRTASRSKASCAPPRSSSRCAACCA